MKRRTYLGQTNFNNVSRPGSVSDKHRSNKTNNSNSFDTLMNSNNSNNIIDDWRVCTIIAIVSIVVYINGLPGDFVHDDIPAITMNKDVLGLSPLSNVFSNDFWGTPMADINSHKSYRPLTILSFRANYLMFGLRPLWFHGTNIVLHATACILFTRVCTVIAKLRKNFAIIAGVLFAVHPIHTEAVTGIVGRADVLACIFFLISLLIYHGKADELDGVAIWFSIVLGGLSMLAKETGVTVFLLNLVYDTYRCWPSLKRAIVDVRWSEETNFFARRVSRVLLSMCVLLALRLALLQGSLPRFSQQDNPTAFHPNIYVRLLTFCYLAAFNWWLCLCPTTLSHDWQMGSIPLLTTISDPRNLLTFVAFGTAVLLAYRGIIDVEQQRHVPLVLGFLLLILPFLPATNLVVTVGFVVAERVLYIPSLGCVLLIVYGAQMLWETFPKCRTLVTLMGILVIAGGTIKTVRRNQDWYSRETLLRAGLAVLPHNAKMHYNFGNFLRDSSKPDIAINHYKQALKLWPTYASAHNNLGTLMNAAELAEHHFLEAIKYSTDHVNAHYNLGQLYRKVNRTSEAIPMLERCIELEPLFIPAYLKLYKLSTGLTAGRILQKVADISSTNPEHITHYGNWLAENNLLHDAKSEFQKALRVEETYQLALIGTCRILRKIGQKSILLQIILRWQLMIRKTNGGGLKQPDIYLRDWSIKHELRNRAMVYDTGGMTGDNNVRILFKSSHQTSSTAARAIRGLKLNSSNNINNHKLENEIKLRIIKTNCNRSDPHPFNQCPDDTQNLNPTETTSLRASTTQIVINKNCRVKRWPKTRYKQKNNIEPNDSVAPLLVAGLLDKL